MCEKLGTIHPRPPYDLDITLSLLSRYTHPSLDVAHRRAYWRLVHSRGGLALLKVIQKGTPHDPRLHVYLVMSTVEPDRDELMNKIAHILGTDFNPKPFYDAARRYPTLWEVIKPLQGLRWLRTETVFEALSMTVIEQQIAWRAAQRAQRWLVEWGRQTLSYDGQRFFAFPRPGQIANASIDDLRPLKITFRRMHVLNEIAYKIRQGELCLEQLREEPPETAYDRLVALRGVGHWTAVWTLQRTHIRQHNFVGYNDVALQLAASHYFYGVNEKLTPQSVQDTFSQFGEYAGLAANYTIMRWVIDRY